MISYLISNKIHFMKNKKILKPVLLPGKEKNWILRVFLEDLNYETKKMDEGKNDFPICPFYEYYRISGF